jgi:hypothetical protein
MLVFCTITLANIIWILYALSDGVRDSFFSHYKSLCKNRDKYKFNSITTLQRLLVLSTTSFIFWQTLGWWSIPFVIGQILMFDFFYKISVSQTCKRIGESKIEPNLFEKIKIFGNTYAITGIVIQIFVYIFLV